MAGQPVCSLGDDILDAVMVRSYIRACCVMQWRLLCHLVGVSDWCPAHVLRKAGEDVLTFNPPPSFLCQWTPPH